MYFSLKIPYLWKAFWMAVLACHLNFLHQSVGEESFGVWYSGVLFFHTPVWFIFLTIADVFVPVKWNNRWILIGSGIGIVVLFLAALFINSRIGVEIPEAVFHVADFVFCVSVLSFWRTKTVE